MGEGVKAVLLGPLIAVRVPRQVSRYSAMTSWKSSKLGLYVPSTLTRPQ
jgi:hypothetical protein